MSRINVSHITLRRRRKKDRGDRSTTKRLDRAGLGLSAFLALLLVLVALGAAWVYTTLVSDLPSLDTLPAMLDPEKGILLQPTRLYDRTGNHLLLALENQGVPRHYMAVDLNQPEHFSPQFLQVTVALTDASFWQNPGFAWWDLASPKPITLAERLVNDLLLGQEAPGLARTLRMRLLAGQLVSRYGRAKVLEWYLNSANYGHLAYGADCAAYLYLGKSASQLDLAESALLASLVETPALNPLDSPAAAVDQQMKALDHLLAQGLLGAQDYLEARQQKLNLQAKPPESNQAAPAFTRLVLQQLYDRFGRSRVERGGLRVITSLDYDLQTQAACTVRTQLLRLESGNPGAFVDQETCEAARLLPSLPLESSMGASGLAASSAILDLQSGQVLVYLGDINAIGDTLPSTGHQPGSLLTPFIALTGFARGMGPASLVWDVQASLPAGLSGIQNPDGKEHGPQRLRMALANDYLLPFARLLDQLGPVNIWRLAEPLGLAGLSEATEPLNLLFSGGDTSLLDLAQAYSAFANQGTLYGQRATPGGRLQPVTTLLVDDVTGRRWLDTQSAESQAVLSPQLAYLVHSILSDDAARWPSLGASNPLEIGRPAGAKVGQSAGGMETWAVGYTPRRLVITWMRAAGNGVTSQPRQPRMAAGIWHALIQHLSRNLPAVGWDIPAGISQLAVCDPSGLLPTTGCPNVVSEVFINGNEPTALDNLYRTVQINRETGLLATVFTPPELVEERTYLAVPPEGLEWAKTSGVPLPPANYDSIQAPPPLENANITAPAQFSYVSGNIEIRGTASGDDLLSFRLDLGKGLNPRAWQQLGVEMERPIKDGLLGTFDTTGLDGLYVVRLVVVRQGQRLDTSVLQITVDNNPPQVSILYPLPNQSIQLADGAVSLQVDVQDTIGIARVAWTLDGKLIGERTDAPFIISWEPTPGEHTLAVKAVDNAGNAGDADPVKFRVE